MVVSELMVVTVRMGVSDRGSIRLAGAGAFPFAEGAALRQSLHVVMVTLLNPTDVLFKAQHLCSVLAERAVHGGVTSENIVHPRAEGLQHQGVVTQLPGGDEVDPRVVLGHPFGVLTDAAHQDTGEQEVRHDHDAAEAEPDDVAQSGLHERKGHP